MRPFKHDSNKPSVPASPSSGSANLKRRGFLLTLGVGSAGAVAVAARSLSTVTMAPDAAPVVADDGGYAATAHVQTYYRTAKV
jgi:hypothetical protein